MKVQELAVEIARQYLRRDAQVVQSHADNVQQHLRRPLQALTAFLLLQPVLPDVGTVAEDENCEKNGAFNAVVDADSAALSEHNNATSEPNVDSSIELSVGGALDPPTFPSTNDINPHQIPSSLANGESDKNASSTVACNTFPFAVEDWRTYVNSSSGAIATQPAKSKDPSGKSGENGYEEAMYERLDRRTKARLEAFLEGVILAVSQEPLVTKAGSDHAGAAGKIVTEPAPSPLVDSVGEATKKALSALKRTNDSASSHSRASRALSTASSSSQKSHGSSADAKGQQQQRRYPQIRERALVTRLELYAKSLWRARQWVQRSVLSDSQRTHPFDPVTEIPLHLSAALLATPEPARSMRTRAQLLVDAFVDTIDNVHQQSTVLSRLLKAATREILAVDHLSESILKFIHRLISNYIQSVSFASLAFLSSPEASANQHLSPKVNQYFKYLHSNWKDCVSECELERMLAQSIDGDLRNTLKNIEFRSIGHLLEVCQGFRTELTKIALAPDMRAPGFDATPAASGDGSLASGPKRDHDDRDAIRQALRDLQREVITVNGSLLPPVTSRKELISLLSQTLNSRTIAAGAAAASSSTAAGKSRRRRQKQQRPGRDSNSGMDGRSGDELTTSDYDTDLSGYGAANATGSTSASRKPGALQRRRSFRLSTIDFLTRRLLLAASRTGTFGDAYFVVRDLFGGEDVEVVPSQSVYRLGRSVRPGSIEISVKLASLTIKCHGSFDVYPKSMVGDCEPLIQLHTTTTETIGLQEVRACDTATQNGSKHDEYDSDEDNGANGERGPVMVVQERLTEKTGWRYLLIRPALYEKYEEFSTPS